MQHPHPPHPHHPPKNANRFFLYVMGGIVGLFIIVFTISYFMKHRDDAPAVMPLQRQQQAVSQPVTQPTEQAKAPVAPENDPQAGVTEADPDPIFVKQHVAKLTKVLNGQLKGARLTLEQNRDPAQTAEIQRRIEMVEKFKAKLEAVNPNDKSTWFFMNDKEALQNNFLPMEETKKK